MGVMGDRVWRVLRQGTLALSAAVFLAALGSAVHAHVAVPVLPIDDGYIHLRYVRNILTGVGPVYNAGVPVMGSSSPLYVAWLTLAGGLCRLAGLPWAADLETLAVRSNALWYVTCMVTMAGLLRRMTGSTALALLLASAAALFSPMLAVSTGAMESYFWGALVLGALWAQSAGRRRVAAALVGLATLARPEGLLLLGLWGLRWLWARYHGAATATGPAATATGTAAMDADADRDHRRPWVELALAAGPLALWIVVATAYYGTPIPHSVIAKASGLYPLPFGWVPNTLLDLSQAWIGGGALGWNPPASVAAGGGYLSLAQGILAALAVGGVLLSARVRRTGAWAPLAMLGLLSLFYIAGRTHLLEWYLPLLWLFWYPALFGGAGALLRAQWEGMQAHRSAWRIAGLTVTAAVFATVFISGPARAAVELAQHPDISRIVRDDPVRMRTLAYRDVGLWLGQNAPAGARLAATEIGTLGYYYDGYLIDACALVSPEALQYIPVPADQRNSPQDGVIANELVQDLQPEYVVSLPTFASASIMRDPWFLAHYRQAATFRVPQPLWGSTHVLVWERTDPTVTP